jgi:hypothetical protein
MNTVELVRRISYWTKEYQFCGKVSLKRVSDHYVVAFEARTTRTRASSMVTRIKLIAAELAEGSDIVVDKDLVSEPPATRDALASWKIYAAIPIKRRLRALQEAWEKKFGRPLIYSALGLQEKL